MNLFDWTLGFLSIFGHLVADSFAHDAIIGGEKANEHQFPYQVSVEILDTHRCGGGIINDFHILTAAHCIIQDNDHFFDYPLFVVAATNDIRKKTAVAVKIEVKTSYVPAEYDAKNMESTGDIAILKLKHSLQSHKSHLQYLKLPPYLSIDYAHKTAKIAGFGWNVINPNDTHGNATNKDYQLRYANTDILSNEQCSIDYQNVEISIKEICARVRQHPFRHRGVCKGDSGGPLVCDDTVVGVLVLTSHDCTERRKPAIYTRVSHYLDFIYNATHKKVSENIRVHELTH